QDFPIRPGLEKSQPISDLCQKISIAQAFIEYSNFKNLDHVTSYLVFWLVDQKS
ncbi:20794_t:CDS:2, partial [Gigaspora rosea]